MKRIIDQVGILIKQNIEIKSDVNYRYEYDFLIFSYFILGDTLFLGGCGRFFEGTATQMYEALIKILSQLPDNTVRK